MLRWMCAVLFTILCIFTLNAEASRHFVTEPGSFLLLHWIFGITIGCLCMLGVLKQNTSIILFAFALIFIFNRYESIEIAELLSHGKPPHSQVHFIVAFLLGVGLYWVIYSFRDHSQDYLQPDLESEKEENKEFPSIRDMAKKVDNSEH